MLMIAMGDDRGPILIKLREQAGKTQEQVAADLNMDQTTISAHERGARPIGRKTMERYADYYGVSLDVIANRAPGAGDYEIDDTDVPMVREESPPYLTAYEAERQQSEPIMLPPSLELRLLRLAVRRRLTLHELVLDMLENAVKEGA